MSLKVFKPERISDRNDRFSDFDLIGIAELGGRFDLIRLHLQHGEIHQTVAPGNTSYIVTNHHVIEGATEIEISLKDGSRVPAELIGSDFFL
jgi:hypothetical protein